MTSEGLNSRKKLITEQSRRFIAQEVIDFIDLPIIDENGSESPHKADLREEMITPSLSYLQMAADKFRSCRGTDKIRYDKNRLRKFRMIG